MKFIKMFYCMCMLGITPLISSSEIGQDPSTSNISSLFSSVINYFLSEPQENKQNENVKSSISQTTKEIPVETSLSQGKNTSSVGNAQTDDSQKDPQANHIMAMDNFLQQEDILSNEEEIRNVNAKNIYRTILVPIDTAHSQQEDVASNDNDVETDYDPETFNETKEVQAESLGTSKKTAPNDENISAEYTQQVFKDTNSVEENSSSDEKGATNTEDFKQQDHQEISANSSVGSGQADAIGNDETALTEDNKISSEFTSEIVLSTSPSELTSEPTDVISNDETAQTEDNKASSESTNETSQTHDKAPVVASHSELTSEHADAISNDETAQTEDHKEDFQATHEVSE
ncbi:hypothetical protein H0X06_07235, partial [Candidatus Dependentiae bacterium]|nr:hypothetical protein [Candidatus Dependentiae bacterium]